MADKKAQGQTAQKAPDPTVFSQRGRVAEYPEGTHPPVSPSDASWGPGRFSYSDMPEEQKPDESTVAQVMDDDPLERESQDALRDSVERSAKAANDAAREQDSGKSQSKQ